MKKLSISMWIVIATLILAGCASVADGAARQDSAKAVSFPAKKTMSAFSSEQELAGYLKELARKQREEEEKREKEMRGHLRAAAPAAKAESAGVAGALSLDAMSSESVTNVQTAGVDEGGIVKVHGNHLVMLRRGRLFTVAIGDGALEPISAVDAYAPDADPSGTWYD